MNERKFLQFQCSKCRCLEYVEAIQEDDGSYEIDETWPIGWIEIYSMGIGLPTEVKDTFCNNCKVPVLEALGYSDYKTYISVVKANTELERRLEQSTVESATIEEEIPFYLLESLDEDVN